MRKLAGAVAWLLLVGVANQAEAQGPPSQAPLPSSQITPERALTPYSNTSMNPSQAYDDVDRRDVPAEQRTGPLDEEERAALARGEYSMGQRVGGAFAAGLLGFGSGQAIQGRWSDTGWIFSAGEPAALTIAIIGLATCPDQGCGDLSRAMAVSGFLAFSALRLWSFADSIFVPGAHNKRLPRLRMRAGLPETARALVPYVVPASRGEGATVGLALRF